MSRQIPFVKRCTSPQHRTRASIPKRTSAPAIGHFRPRQNIDVSCPFDDCVHLRERLAVVETGLRAAHQHSVARGVVETSRSSSGAGNLVRAILRNDPGSFLLPSRSENFVKHLSASRRYLFALAVLPLVICAAEAPQVQTAIVPSNAHAAAYGSGWECNSGYRRSQSTCAAIMLPDHSFATGSSYGLGWECNRTFRRVGATCVAVVLPMNSYATESSYDRGWSCLRGYRRVDTKCEAIAIPANGYLDYGGDTWKCDRGFSARDGSCVAINLPSNAFLDATGNEWKCDRGYRKGGQSCVELTVPPGAHIDYSGNDWTCDDGLRRRDANCILREQDVGFAGGTSRNR